MIWADNKYNNGHFFRGEIMDKKNVLGLLFFMGIFGVVISGMVAFQPEKTPTALSQTAGGGLQGFPVLPSHF